MTEEVKEHPLAKVAKWKLEQAEGNGGHKCALWNATGKYWTVASATRKGVEHRVRLKQSDRHLAESRAALNRDQRTGFGWLFTLTCDCEAAQQGLFCWHLGAVRLWWAWHHALTGDQVAERNLRAAKQKRQDRASWDEDHPPFPTLEGPGDFGGLDEWDVGPDHHEPERAAGRKWNPDRETWQDDEQHYQTDDGNAERIRVMLHNTNTLLNGGGK